MYTKNTITRNIQKKYKINILNTWKTKITSAHDDEGVLKNCLNALTTKGAFLVDNWEDKRAYETRMRF